MPDLSKINWSRVGVLVGTAALEALIGYVDSNPAVFGPVSIVLVAGARQLDHALLGWKPEKQ